eukprot:scaffold37957_cov67-Phaeocystis_antarctica.AAC.2
MLLAAHRAPDALERGDALGHEVLVPIAVPQLTHDAVAEGVGAALRHHQAMVAARGDHRHLDPAQRLHQPGQQLVAPVAVAQLACEARAEGVDAALACEHEAMLLPRRHADHVLVLQRRDAPRPPLRRLAPVAELAAPALAEGEDGAVGTEGERVHRVCRHRNDPHHGPAERPEWQRRRDGSTDDLVAVAEEAVPVAVGAAGEKPPLGVREGRVHPASGEDSAAPWTSPLSPAKELRPRDLALGKRRVALVAHPRTLAQSHLHQRSEAAAGAAHSAEVVGGSTDEHAHEELGWQRVDGLEHREREAGRQLSS